MANSLFSCVKTSYLVLNISSNLSRNTAKSFSAPFVRTLYSYKTLGLDAYKDQRERTKQQMVNIIPRFKEKMSEYITEDSKNMIFTEDLKNMMHIAETDEDLDLVVKMLKKYNQQNSSLRFGNYVFGPVVMRLFYVQDKPDLALECFKSEEFKGIFDQFMSYQLLMDLLYENGKYKEMLEVLQIIKDKQLEGSKYPKNVVVLALAACYKMNSKESLDFALNLWKDLQETGHVPMRRAVTFCAALAINQGKPEVGLEILTHSKNQSYTTVRNLKVLALAQVNRLEDIIPIIKSILAEDIPQSPGKLHTFNKEILDKVREIAKNNANADLSHEFDRLEQLLQKEGRIVDTPLDEQLCHEIQPPAMMNQRSFQQRFPQNRTFQRDNRNQRGAFQRDDRQRYSQRPGLNELM